MIDQFFVNGNTSEPFVKITFFFNDLVFSVVFTKNPNGVRDNTEINIARNKNGLSVSVILICGNG